MATVTSFTSSKILELASGWEQVAEDQAELTISVSTVKNKVDNHDTRLDELEQVVLPELQFAVGSQQIALDTALLDLEAIPKTFFSPNPPISITNRDLQIGDIWNDTDDEYRQYRWDGTQWISYSNAIPDLSLGVRKIYSSMHLIY